MTIGAEKRWRVAYRDGFICWICEEPVDMTLPMNSLAGPTMDHFIERRRADSTDDIENLRLAHARCNGRRDSIGVGALRAANLRWHQRQEGFIAEHERRWATAEDTSVDEEITAPYWPKVLDAYRDALYMVDRLYRYAMVPMTSKCRVYSDGRMWCVDLVPKTTEKDYTRIGEDGSVVLDLQAARAALEARLG